MTMLHHQTTTTTAPAAIAYKGARFTTTGHCPHHPSVRMCRVTPEGQYKILRKTCYKCGTAALMTDNNNLRSQNKNSGIHGYKKKASVGREVERSLFARGRRATTTTVVVDNGNGSGSSSSSVSKRGGQVRDGGNKRGDQVAGRQSGSIAAGSSGERSGRSSRAKTLSPRRIRSRSRSIATRNNTVSASSHVIQRMSDDKIEGLAKPPFSRGSGRGGSASSQHSNYAADDIINKEKEIILAARAERRARRELRRPRKKHAARGSKHTVGTSNDDRDHDAGGDDAAIMQLQHAQSADSEIMQPTSTAAATSPPSSHPCTPEPKKKALALDDYFSNALVLYQGDTAAQAADNTTTKKSNHPPPKKVPAERNTTTTHGKQQRNGGEKKDGKTTNKDRNNNNWKALPRSSARMARTDGIRKSRRERSRSVVANWVNDGEPQQQIEVL